MATGTDSVIELKDSTITGLINTPILRAEAGARLELSGTILEATVDPSQPNRSSVLIWLDNGMLNASNTTARTTDVTTLLLESASTATLNNSTLSITDTTPTTTTTDAAARLIDNSTLTATNTSFTKTGAGYTLKPT